MIVPNNPLANLSDVASTTQRPQILVEPQSWWRTNGEYVTDTLYWCAVVVTSWAAITFSIVLFGLARRFLAVKLGKTIKANRQRAILITGGTSGIGLAAAKHFYGLGFTVFVGYFNDKEPGYNELMSLSARPAPEPGSRAGELTPSRQHLFLVYMDVRSQESIEVSCRQIEAILDHNEAELYALINNAGTSVDGPFEWSSGKSISDCIATNLTGVVMVTRQFIMRIIKAKGRVINVSTGLYKLPGPAISMYGATKSAVAFFSDALNADISIYGARCICVMPGNFFTTSNILYTRIRHIQDSIALLTPHQKETYSKSIEVYSGIMFNLLKSKLRSGNVDPDELATVHGLQVPDWVMEPDKNRRVGLFRRIATYVDRTLDGGASRGQSLEQTGIIGGYDYAVRLLDPPRRLYAGNSFYSHISGPLLEYMPQVILDPLGASVVENMKNN